MAVKKLIENQPSFGDLSQYNFPDGYVTDPPQYSESISLPIDNDKYTKKDLQTTIYSSDINESILDYNLKFIGESFIRVDNIVVDNAGVNYDIKNIRLRGFLFSKKSYKEKFGDDRDPLTDDYDSLNELNGSDFTFYAKSFGDLRENNGLGSINDMQGINIVENFGANTLEVGVGDFPNNSTAFNTGSAFDRESSQTDPQTSIIEESGVYNPLYFAFWMKGDADRWFGTDRRKRRFQVFEVTTEQLFTSNGGGQVTPITFEDGVSNNNQTGGGGSGAAEAAAFKITSFSITINTLSGVSIEDSNITTEPQLTYMTQVLPPRRFTGANFLDFTKNNNLFFNYSPYQEIKNSEPDGGPIVDLQGNDLFPDYYTFTTLGVLDSFNNQTDVDLQTYHPTNSIQSIKSSAPATVVMDVDFFDTFNNQQLFTGGQLGALYFVIHWDDKDDEIKTLDDYLETKPNNYIDLLELQQNNLYKVYSPAYTTTDRKPQHSYTTPGIKTIKFVTITYDSYPYSTLGRWKLCKTRFFLDIPINQYPDFGELGGSDYVTIPWPYTTAVIGGVDENSKYKTSIRDTLSGGKIGDTDIIDEKFLVNDRDNDELGQSITKMDFEQCRYFNKYFSINDLLNINPITDDDDFIPYDYIPDTEDEIEDIYVFPATTTPKLLMKIRFRHRMSETEVNGNPVPLPEEEYIAYQDRWLTVPFLDNSGNPYEPPQVEGFYEINHNISQTQQVTGTELGPDFPAYVTIQSDGTYTGGTDMDGLFNLITVDDTNNGYKLYINPNQFSEQFIQDIVTISTNEPSGIKLYMFAPDDDGYVPIYYTSNQNITQIQIWGLPLYDDFDHPAFHNVDEGDIQLDYQNGEFPMMKVLSFNTGDGVINNGMMLTAGDYQDSGENLYDYGVSRMQQSDINPDDGFTVNISSNDIYWDGEINIFPMESSVGQIFINDNQDLDLKQSCKLELNTGELTGKSIYDSSGNSNKGILIGDYKVKKVRKGEPMRRDSFIKVPKKTGNTRGAL